MKQELFMERSHIQAPAKEVFEWHGRPGALERLSPPFYREKILEWNAGLEAGARSILKLPLGPLTVDWISEHQGVHREKLTFRDQQIKGPFAYFDHEHRFAPAGDGVSIMEDKIEYVLPWGAVGKCFGKEYVRRRIKRIFDYRHRLVRQDISLHQRYSNGSPLHILVTGASGSIGQALVPFLTTGGHRVSRLVRSKPRGPHEIFWDPRSDTLEREKLEGMDAVVNLAGENIFTQRWTSERKKEILESRVDSTRVLCEVLSHLKDPPKVLVSASAIGYYGNRNDEILAEESSSGEGFLAEVCRKWERATQPAIEKGIRVVQLRIGVVLNPLGGALARMLPAFQVGLGGKLGAGNQFVSWIAQDDLLGTILHTLKTKTLGGPVNAVSPNAVTNREFTRTLGRILSRPTVFSIPPFVLRLLYGPLADEALLSGARVQPTKLVKSGFRFHCFDLEDALGYLLGRGDR